MLNLAKKVVQNSPRFIQSVKYLQTTPLITNKLQQTVAKPQQNQPTKVINPLKYENFFQTNELVDLEELFK
jgi:hypothetical protein